MGQGVTCSIEGRELRPLVPMVAAVRAFAMHVVVGDNDDV